MVDTARTIRSTPKTGYVYMAKVNSNGNLIPDLIDGKIPMEQLPLINGVGETQKLTPELLRTFVEDSDNVKVEFDNNKIKFRAVEKENNETKIQKIIITGQSGALTINQYKILNDNELNCILCDGEMYYLAQNGEVNHKKYVLVGEDAQHRVYIKTITVDGTTLAWTKTTIRVNNIPAICLKTEAVSILDNNICPIYTNENLTLGKSTTGAEEYKFICNALNEMTVILPIVVEHIKTNDDNIIITGTSGHYVAKLPKGAYCECRLFNKCLYMFNWNV